MTASDTSGREPRPEGGDDPTTATYRSRRPHQFPRRWIAIVAALLSLVIALVIVRSSAQPAPAVATSTAVDSWVLPRLGGDGTVRLSDFRGQPTVVNFFASWCTACRGELPGFATVSRQLSNKVHFVFVDAQDSGDALAMARQYHIDSQPLARDVGGADSSGLHDQLTTDRGMPITAFYDQNGRLVGTSLAAMAETTLRQKLHDYYGLAVS